MNRKLTAIEWKAEQFAQEKAGRQADELVVRLKLSGPIDPLSIAKDEYPLLRVGGRNFGNRFDGKIRFNSSKRCFLLMYNTKYDIGQQPGSHHPRTRFSISHELGHYFIQHHHSYLSHGGRPHPSTNEFRSLTQIEREADAFAASLLLPTDLVRPVVNTAELSVKRVDNIACDFKTSRVSTLIRCVQLSDFPCAVAGIRDGAVAWVFSSETLIGGGLYPRRRVLSPNARNQWAEFCTGAADVKKTDGKVRDWFETYDRDYLYDLFATEEFIPVQSVGTLLVLLTLDERDVFQLREDNDDPEEEE